MVKQIVLLIGLSYSLAGFADVPAYDVTQCPGKDDISFSYTATPSFIGYKINLSDKARNNGYVVLNNWLSIYPPLLNDYKLEDATLEAHVGPNWGVRCYYEFSNGNGGFELMSKRYTMPVYSELNPASWMRKDPIFTSTDSSGETHSTQGGPNDYYYVCKSMNATNTQACAWITQ